MKRLSYRLFALLVVASFVWMFSESAHAQLYVETRPVVLATPSDVAVSGTHGEPAWRRTFDFPASRYVQLRFTGVSFTPGARFAIVVSDSVDHRALYRYGPEDVAAGVLVTGPIFDQGFEVRVEDLAAPHTLSFRLTDVLQPWPEDFEKLSIVPNWYRPSQLPNGDPGRRLSAAVAKLFFPGTTSLEPRCTGFLIAQDVIVTAYHCIAQSPRFATSTAASKRPCDDAQAQFDYVVEPRQGPAKLVRCSVVEIWSQEKDVAVLRLASAAPPTPAGPRPVLKLAAADIPPMTRAILLHHPIGIPVRLSECRPAGVDAAKPLVLTHGCSTLGGSSGAPLMTEDGALVGVHVWGPFKQNDTTGAIEAGVQAGRDYQNRAVPISALRAILQPYAVTP